MTRSFLSIREAHDETGLSETHLRRHAPTVRVGRRVLVPRTWLDGLAP